MCHNIPLTKVKVWLELDQSATGVLIHGEAQTIGQTGGLLFPNILTPPLLWSESPGHKRAEGCILICICICIYAQETWDKTLHLTALAHL